MTGRGRAARKQARSADPALRPSRQRGAAQRSGWALLGGLQASVGNRAVTALLQGSVQRQEQDRQAADTPIATQPPDLRASPEVLQAALGDIPNLSALLRLGPLGTPARAPWLDTLPEPRPGASAPARPGTGGDLAAALSGVPQIDRALDTAKEKLVRDWDRLSTGEKLVVAVTGLTVASPLLAHPDVRTALDGKAVPKPATGALWVDNIDIVLHTAHGGVGVGLQVDIGGLLRGRKENTAPAVQRSPLPVAAVPPVARQPDTPVRTPSSALLELDRIARAGSPVRVPMPEGMIGTQAWALTVSIQEAARLAALARRQLPAAAPEPGRPRVESVTFIYANDGRAPFPNIGGGADHELTAVVRVRQNFAEEGTGWTSGGHNLEIWTPQKGGPPGPLPGHAAGLYPGQPGPDTGGYRGLVYADFAYRLSGNGEGEFSLLTKAGVNSTRLGEAVQSGLVHIPLDIPLFDWKHEPNELYAGLGLRAATLLDLVRDDSLAQGELRIRLAMSAEAAAGTHDAHAGGAATLSIRSGYLRLGRARGSLEFRIGADGRGQVRYNDQGATRAGLEAGLSNEFRLNLQDVPIPLLGPTDMNVFAGGRSQQSTLPEGRAVAGEDRPSGTGAWLGPGSKAQGYLGIEIPLR